MVLPWVPSRNQTYKAQPLDLRFRHLLPEFHKVSHTLQLHPAFYLRPD